MKKNQKKQQNEIIVLVDPKIYSLEAVYGAAYLFLDEAYFYLEEGPKSKIKVNIKGKEKLTDKRLENLKDEFLNELVNSDLRDKISKNNKKMREYILSKALASALDQGFQGEMNKSLQKCSHEPQGHLKKQLNEEVWNKDDLKKEFMKDLFQEYEKDPEKIAVPWEKKQENFIAPWREEKQKNKVSNKKKNKKITRKKK